MMQRLRAFLMVPALLALGMILTPPPQSALAAPPRAETTGYSIVTLFTADPTSAEYTASFAPTAQSVFAWAFMLADKGAPEKQFQVDVQFISPMGQKVESQWYSGDTGKVTTLPKESYDAGKWTAKNVARRQINIAGTPNAALTGQWTVKFNVGGKTMAVQNFTLATASDVDASDAQLAAQQELEQLGYTVDDFDTTTWDDGTVVAWATMPMVSRDLYSAETSKQLVDGFAVVRKGFPQATVLFVDLEYNERYTVSYWAKASDWDAYVKSKDFKKFSGTLTNGVWDNEMEDWVTDTKDFIKKNFGAGTPKAPLSTPGVETGTVGSIQVQVSPSSLPADGTSTARVTVTVFDKRNKALPNTDLTFTTSGTGAGTIRPKATATDNKGGATATFTAGTKAGTMTITAAVGKTTGTAVVTLGEKDTDDVAGDNVRTLLASEGFTVVDVGYDQAQSGALVMIDLGAKFTGSDLGRALVMGHYALRENYPAATTLGVVIPYQRTYYLILAVAAADWDKFVAEYQVAGGNQKKKDAAMETYLAHVFENDRSVLLDAQTMEPVSSAKDFVNKNFGG